MQDFSVPDKKPSISRASILTGLTRKEVQRLLTAADDAEIELPSQYNRAARVMTGWIRDADFLDEHAQPRPLSVDGELSFDTLARRYSGDMPARAVLDELQRVGAVRLRDDGLIEALARAYVPQQSVVDKLEILGTDVADLVSTIDHNMQYGGSDPRFQRKVLYNSVDVTQLPAFRRLSTTQAQALLERLDRWLSEHDTDSSPGPTGAPRARIGMGIYYIEERLPSESDQGTST